jgi:hypothetical protein
MGMADGIQRMGGGIIVPLHRASIVVIPEVGLRIVNKHEHIQLINEADPSRAIISFDWVTSCVEQDVLLQLAEYKLRCNSVSHHSTINHQDAYPLIDSTAASVESDEVIKAMDQFYAKEEEQDEHDSNDLDAATPKIGPVALDGAVPIAPPIPPKTPSINSVTDNLENMAGPKTTSNKSGVIFESMEVPEHLMSSFFWLEDKFHIWERSGFWWVSFCVLYPSKNGGELLFAGNRLS